ncbi:amino acid permease [Paucilactobacillus wasatchensis]|uniref:D-serine/D-alanine/glycine transporter n=1 Tax=Paucilactobacillus wasatchensis TaxID=1335616 RepID=A0A0D0Y7Z1_9LACO|nr:amino acid permease [Paucilactobacillus wasatchensis]KIS04373.1 D-serine/D-alanine/glycine transporter [Paucilactobacillus wasatchensis]
MKEQRQLSRSLQSRHIQMIAIGGAIGTGLFLGSGSAIRKAGPSIILSYLIVGIFCFFMMRAIGELLLSDTSKHSFIDFIKLYLGDRMEFITGWTYWSCWLSLAMADLTATGIYLKYWFPSLPQWVGPLVIILLLLLVNLVNVGLFGELESWFSMIKVVAILALIVVGLGMTLFHFRTGTSTASFSNLVSHGGFFPTGVSGFLMSFQMVVFAFVGIEMVGLTAGETKDPHKDLPRAINSLPIRIGLFYIGSMIAIMCVAPWNTITTTSSPFVQVFSGIGITSAAAILNFVVLTAAMSATNSAIFSTSRTLHALATGGNAMHRFTKLSRHMVPNTALHFSSAILFVVVILNYLMPAGIFNLISGVSTINFVFVWLIMLWCHIKFRRAQPAGVKEFLMPGYPVTDWASLVFFTAVLIFLLFDPETRISLVVSVVWFVALFAVYGLRGRKQKNS